MSLVLLGLLLIPQQDPKLERLIRQLGDERPDVRERATKSLIEKGPKISPALDRILKTDPEPEVASRIARIQRAIERNELIKRLPKSFSEPFRRAAPELIEKLAKPTPETLLEAIGKTSGLTVRWDEDFDEALPDLAPKLKEATEKDQIEVVRAALRAFRGAGRNRRWTMVKEALVLLETPFESDALLKEVLPLLDDPHPEFRDRLLDVVRCLRGSKHLPVLLELLDRNSREIQEAAADALRVINPGEHAPRIADRIDKTDGRTQAALLRCLSLTRDSRYAEKARSLVQSRNPNVQRAAIRALAILDPDGARGLLLLKLNSDDSKVVRAAIHSVGSSRDPEIIRALERIVFEAKDESNANQAIYTLSGLDSDRFTEIILFGLKHKSDSIRNAAAVNAHRAKQGRVVKALEKALKDKHPGVCANAASSLAWMGIKGHEPEMRELLSSGNAYTRGVVASALGRLGDTESFEMIVQLLDDPDRGVQGRALHALGNLGMKGAEEKIRPKLQSKEEWIWSAAAFALARMGDEACVPVLINALESERGWNELGYLALFAHPRQYEVLESARVADPGTREVSVGALIDRIAESLRDRGLEVQEQLPKAHEERRVLWRTPGDAALRHVLYWIYRSCDRSLGWYLDENTLQILPKVKAAALWKEWAGKR